MTLCWLKKTIRSLSLAAIIFFLHLTVIFIMFISLVSSQYIYICLKAWKCFKMYMSVHSQHWSICLPQVAMQCRMDRCLKYTSEYAVSQFCKLDTSHTAVYCIFIIHTGFKACRGIQGIYANEDWWLLWSPRISSVNSLYGKMHYSSVMMSLSEQCACVKQLGWVGFFVYIFLLSLKVTTRITW